MVEKKTARIMIDMTLIPESLTGTGKLMMILGQETLLTGAILNLGVEKDPEKIWKK